MVKLRWLRDDIVCFFVRNKGALLLSAAIICISFWGTIIALLFTGEAEYANIQNYSETATSIGEIDLGDINWVDIFMHNLIILSPVILGVFTFGFVSLWYMVWQNYLLGHAIYCAVQQAPLLTVLKYTVPHGIFEFLAIWLVGAFALNPFVILVRSIVFNGGFIGKRDFRDMMIMLLLFLVVLLFAAMVEVFITAKL